MICPVRGPTEIKVIYNTASNYLVQGSDVHKNIRAFNQAGFSVTHDYFLTPTALHSDVVLPATTYLERSDIVFPTAGNYLLFSNQVLPPLHEARNDYDIFCALADRLGFLEQFSEGKDEDAWLRSFVDASEVPDYDEFRRTGIYLAPDQLRVGLADFVRDPAAHPLDTPSGLVEISSQTYAQDTGFSPIPECRILETSSEYPLRLVTPKSKFRIHSQGSNIPWMRKREAQTLWMNSQDALQRGIQDGDQILAHNEQGRVRVAVRVTADIMPSVVCLLEGVWPEFNAAGVDTAGSPNVLSSTAGTEPSKGTATHSILIQVAHADV